MTLAAVAICIHLFNTLILFRLAVHGPAPNDSRITLLGSYFQQSKPCRGLYTKLDAIQIAIGYKENAHTDRGWTSASQAPANEESDARTIRKHRYSSAF